MYYYPLQQPYFLLVVGFFTALTSGLALSGTLKVIVQEWPQDKSAKEKTNTRSFYKQLLMPFVGITGGSCLFLCSGFETILNTYYACYSTVHLREKAGTFQCL